MLGPSPGQPITIDPSLKEPTTGRGALVFEPNQSLNDGRSPFGARYADQADAPRRQTDRGGLAQASETLRGSTGT